MSKRWDLFAFFFVIEMMCVAVLVAGIWYSNWWLIGIGAFWCIGTSLVWLYCLEMTRKPKDGDLHYHDTI